MTDHTNGHDRRDELLTPDQLAELLGVRKSNVEDRVAPDD
jgi:hypothetical protein